MERELPRSASALGIGSLLTGVGAGQLVTGALNFAETIYNFNFNQTDEDINKEIESTINALYGPTGEYIGQQVAGFWWADCLTRQKCR